MLLSLYIRDFGIVEKTEINFIEGLNVLTGETGSGKSIVVEAIQVAAGGRASTEYIRSGCDRALVQATVDAGRIRGFIVAMSERGILPEEDGVLVLTREINRSGRNTCRINGQVVTLNVYREIGQLIVDIQGQYEQQLLFSPERQLYLLDAYGGGELTGLSAGVSRLYRLWREKSGQLTELRRQNQEWVRSRETTLYEIDDIDGVSPQPGEDLDLEAEKARLSNSEKISRLAGDCYRELYANPGASTLETAGRSLKTLEKLVALDDGLGRVKELVAGALYQVEEACRELAAYLDSLEFYPARLEFVEDRLNQLEKLKKKYGGSLDKVLGHRRELATRLEDISAGNSRLETMESETGELSAELYRCARLLSEKRREQAGRLEADIARELIDLEMGRVSFVINFTERESIGDSGSERAEFYISTNPGEPVRPLAKIASGGETSRIMLAIKGILAGIEDIPTLIFDEVDSGIGGHTIKSVAFKLYSLSRGRQVICVTHSPVVASLAGQHLSVRKLEAGERTLSTVMALEGEQRVEELARMMGGVQSGEAAVNHARQLIDEATLLKNTSY